MHNFIDAYSWINLRYLLQGLGVTLEVSIVSIFFSFILGVILGLARYVKIKYFSAIVGFVIDLIRNLPLLLILFFTYFALPDIGIRLNVVAAAIIAMSIFESAMLAEIVRSGINAVPRGQMEAARSNGLTFYQAMRYIIMPQALKKMIPPIVSQFISLVKDTSLANANYLWAEYQLYDPDVRGAGSDVLRGQLCLVTGKSLVGSAARAVELGSM